MILPASPILWQNEEKTVTVLDIPHSIAAAQGTGEHPCVDCLRSSEPRKVPYRSQEPKTGSAKARLEHNTVQQELHEKYQILLTEALENINEHYDREWCLERLFTSGHDTSQPPKKRRLNDHGLDDAKGEFSDSAKTDERTPALTASDSSRIKEKDEQNVCSICNAGDVRFQANCNSISLNKYAATRSTDLHCKQELFRMPPYSSFFLGDVSERSSVTAFHAAIRNQANAHETRRHFDFILMDPPWPNRSAKRTYVNGSGYHTSGGLNEISKLLLGTDLDVLMANNCLVGIWITNRQSIRDLVLGSIFAYWGLELEEEWIWLKSTMHGEPISELTSLWRKPYEVLLLGRRRQSYDYNLNGQMVTPKRRVVVSVPDMHSRKPCLKGLIEGFLVPDGTDYRALELFSRHLVSGWWSWGDDCTKFNFETHWYRPNEDPSSIK